MEGRKFRDFLTRGRPILGDSVVNMKTLIIVPIALAAAMSFATAEEKKADKTLGEKTSETVEKAKEATKDAGRAVAEKTKQAADAVKDAVTPDTDARKVDVRLIDGKIEMPK